MTSKLFADVDVQGRESVELGRSVGCDISPSVRIVASSLELGSDVRIGEAVTLVADEVEIGEGVTIGAGTDLRASSIRIGHGSEIGEEVHALVAEQLDLGSAARVQRGVSLVCRSFEAGRLLFLGHGVSVGYGGTTGRHATVRLGDRVAINPRSILNANSPIAIGDDVGTGCDLTIWTHGFHFGHGPLDGFRIAFEGVTIENNAWLAYGVTILPGCVVGANSIVAACSVVVGNIPPNVVAAGSPAKVKGGAFPAPVCDNEARKITAELLDEWVDDLLWKGCRVTPIGSGAYNITVPGDDRCHIVRFLDGATKARPGDAIWVSLDARPELSRHLDRTVLFELRSRAKSGPPLLLAEDLRDFLRRHGTLCGDTEVFRSIDPEPFARLRAGHTAPNEAE